MFQERRAAAQRATAVESDPILTYTPEGENNEKPILEEMNESEEPAEDSAEESAGEGSVGPAESIASTVPPSGVLNSQKLTPTQLMKNLAA